MIEEVKNPTGVIPVADRVIVKVVAHSNESPSGIKVQRDRALVWKGQVVDFGVEVDSVIEGNYVLYQDGANFKTFEIGEEKYHLIREEQIWVKWDGKPDEIGFVI